MDVCLAGCKMTKITRQTRADESRIYFTETVSTIVIRSKTLSIIDLFNCIQYLY